jgi:hypothetical protein
MPDMARLPIYMESARAPIQADIAGFRPPEQAGSHVGKEWQE